MLIADIAVANMVQKSSGKCWEYTSLFIQWIIGPAKIMAAAESVNANKVV
jgi:hypothetical protein